MITKEILAWMKSSKLIAEDTNLPMNPEEEKACLHILRQDVLLHCPDMELVEFIEAITNATQLFEAAMTVKL